MLSEGSLLPKFKLLNQKGEALTNENLAGKRWVIYFYPKDLTPGCTTESCDFRDYHELFKKHNVEILGVSKDSQASHEKFIAKHTLSFDLLIDDELELAQACGVWVEKSMYGKKYMGIERTTLLIDETGKVEKIWRKVKVKGHVEQVFQNIETMG